MATEGKNIQEGVEIFLRLNGREIEREREGGKEGKSEKQGMKSAGERDREKKEKTEKIGCFVTGVCTIRLRCRVKRINVLTHTAARDNVYTHGPLGEGKKMRKLSHFVQPPFLFASLFHSSIASP